MSETPKAGHNGFDPDKLNDYVERYETIQGEIDGIMEEARHDCQPKRDEMKELKKEAAENGFPKKEFAAVIRTRRLQRQAEAVRSGLDEDSQDLYDNMRLALGDLADLPLGEAALENAAA